MELTDVGPQDFSYERWHAKYNWAGQEQDKAHPAYPSCGFLIFNAVEPLRPIAYCHSEDL